MLRFQWLQLLEQRSPILLQGVFSLNNLPNQWTGKYFYDTLNRDYPMIMATFLLVAFLWGVLYLLTDIAYTLIDPRVRLGEKSVS